MVYADIVKCFGRKCSIYSLDISFDCLHETAKKRDDITFIKADVSKEMAKVFPEKMLKVFDTNDLNENIIQKERSSPFCTVSKILRL